MISKKFFCILMAKGAEEAGEKPEYTDTPNM